MKNITFGENPKCAEHSVCITKHFMQLVILFPNGKGKV